MPGLKRRNSFSVSPKSGGAQGHPAPHGLRPWFYIVQLCKENCQATREFWRLESLEPRKPVNSLDDRKQLTGEAKMPPVAVPRFVCLLVCLLSLYGTDKQE